MPPIVQLVKIGYSSTPVDGKDALAVSAAVKDAVISYLATLGPGEPLYVSSLYGAMKPIQGLLKVRFWAGASSTPLDDTYPADDTVIRSDVANAIEV